ncbi:hypothetical protein BB561_001648 [Smittium simulii]|uniref:DUF7719 domain-containing protein n=1 Tax=Smittium simulii TaxID=133385 RepID=A0A2T9YTP4_9FUNG|nr:hypothetical protein BB561_001648 [Smittium simulii]
MSKNSSLPENKPKHLIDLIPERKLLQNKKIAQFLEQDRNKNINDEADSSTHSDSDNTTEEPFQFSTFANSVFYSLALLFIYATFLVLVHQQYGLQIEFSDILRQTFSAAPSILIFVYFTFTLTQFRLSKFLYIIFASFFGCYFIHLNLHSPRLGVMKRTPGLITLWIYLIMLLDMRATLINIFCVGVFWMVDPFKKQW